MDSHDHHNKGTYSVSTNKDNELYEGYVRTQCTQQSQPQQNQHFLSPYAMPVAMSNNMPQQLVYNAQNQPVYNIMYGSQAIYRNQNTFPVTTSLNTFTQPVDPIPWVSDSCVINTDPKDKYDNKLKENNSSCCGERVAVDNIACSSFSTVYKTVNKGFYYNKNSIMDSHWFYSTNYDNEKYSELPSCSRLTSDNNVNSQCCDLDTSRNIKSVKYCSIQKYPDTESKLFTYSNKQDGNNDLYGGEQQYKVNKDYSSCSQLQQCHLYNNSTYTNNDNKKDMLNQCSSATESNIVQNHHGYYPNENTLHFNVPKINDKVTEESNGAGGESDIVVEDSEEEVSDESDELEKEENQCFMCHTLTEENHFYVVTSDTPLTSYSQIPVFQFLSNIIGINEKDSNNLCRNCMNLVNTADNLQMQLNVVKQELMSKYKMSVESLKIYVNKNVYNPNIQSGKKIQQRKRKFKSRDVCGIHSFKCSVCEKIFSLKKFYLFHMAKHKTKTKYLCEHCGCNFVKHSSLVAHLRKHTATNNVPVKSFVCHICGKLFKSKTNLIEHENNCSGNLPFNCTICERRFPSSTKLKHHIQLSHDKEFNVCCQTCGKGFVKQSDLKTHLLTHSSVKKYQCTKCQKCYKTLSNLNHHLKTHNDKLPFTCTLCSKGFLRKENLQTHLNLHNGVKPFGCSICNKKFASQKNLDAHLKIHNGTAKQKMCPICGKQIRHGLDDHIRTHSTIKELECEICFMKFLTKGALSKHKKRKHDNMDVDIL